MSMRGRLGLGKGWVTFPPGSKEEKRRGEVTRQRGFKRERKVEVFIVFVSTDYMAISVVKTGATGRKKSLAPDPRTS